MHPTLCLGGNRAFVWRELMQNFRLMLQELVAAVARLETKVSAVLRVFVQLIDLRFVLFFFACDRRRVAERVGGHRPVAQHVQGVVRRPLAVLLPIEPGGITQ